MVDIIAFAIALLTVAAVMIRKTSAGVGILSLLAGVLLDQLLSEWAISLLPKSDAIAGDYTVVIVHLLLTFIPVVATIVAVRVKKHNAILSLLASLVLGFLITFFGLKIVASLPLVSEAAKNSGLLHFLDPYQNAILAGSAILALVEMILSHAGKDFKKKK
jgi:hypothetical protein